MQSLSTGNFWRSIRYCLNFALLSVKVIQLVNMSLGPSMGYVYQAMDRTKEQIQTNLENKELRYKKIWVIID